MKTYAEMLEGTRKDRNPTRDFLRKYPVPDSQMVKPVVKPVKVRKEKQGVAEATGDKPFDKIMTTIKQGTNKQKTADRKEQQKQTQQRARDAFGGNPADKLSIRKGVSEGNMPQSVIRNKQKYSEMSDQEFHAAHKDKSVEELQAMSRRHGYGKDSNHYVVRHKKGQPVVEASNTAQRYGQQILQRVRAQRDAEARDAEANKEKPQTSTDTSSTSTRDLLQQLRRPNTKKKEFKDRLAKEELDEVLNPSMGAGEYIKDFQKSDAPQFKGKSKEKKRMMGIAAYLQAKRGVKEEVEIEEGYFSDQDVQRQDKRIASAKAKKAMTPPFSGPYTKSPATTTDKSGAVHTPMSRAKHLARMAMQQKMKEEFGVDIDDVMADSLVETVLDEIIWLEEEQIDEAHTHVVLVSYFGNHTNPVVRGGKVRVTANNHDAAREEALRVMKEMGKKNVKAHSSKSVDSSIEHNFKEEVEQMDEAPLRAVSALVGYPKLNRKIATKGTPGSEDERNKAAAGLRKDRSGLGRRAYTGDQHYDVRREENESINLGDVDFDDDGTLVTNKVSYSDFLKNLQEIKLADLPKRNVAGRSYGSQKDKSFDDESEDKPKAAPAVPAVKRGRGRPTGSKSGANQKVSSGGQRTGVEYTGHKLHLPNTNKSY